MTCCNDRLPHHDVLQRRLHIDSVTACLCSTQDHDMQHWTETWSWSWLWHSFSWIIQAHWHLKYRLEDQLFAVGSQLILRLSTMVGLQYFSACQQCLSPCIQPSIYPTASWNTITGWATSPKQASPWALFMWHDSQQCWRMLWQSGRLLQQQTWVALSQIWYIIHIYFVPPDAESKSASNESIFKLNRLHLSVLCWEYYAAL